MNGIQGLYFDIRKAAVRQGVRFSDLPTLAKCAKGICIGNLLQSTQPNDWESVIEG